MMRPLTRVEKSKVARLWKRYDQLSDEQRKHPSKRIEAAIFQVSQDLYALGEV